MVERATVGSSVGMSAEGGQPASRVISKWDSGGIQSSLVDFVIGQDGPSTGVSMVRRVWYARGEGQERCCLGACPMSQVCLHACRVLSKE